MTLTATRTVAVTVTILAADRIVTVHVPGFWPTRTEALSIIPSDGGSIIDCGVGGCQDKSGGVSGNGKSLSCFAQVLQQLHSFCDVCVYRYMIIPVRAGLHNDVQRRMQLFYLLMYLLWLYAFWYAMVVLH